MKRDGNPLAAIVITIFILLGVGLALWWIDTWETSVHPRAVSVAYEGHHAHPVSRYLHRIPPTTAVKAPVAALTLRPKVSTPPKVSVAHRAPQGFAAWAASKGTWRVFNCESHWNPKDVSSSGKYRGLIQADATFWKSWHGLQFAPRADLATTNEQLQVAYWAWLKVGWSKWPTCGKLA